MSIVSLNLPSTFCTDVDHRIRIMHMLMCNGRRMGHGKNELAGHVMYSLDGKMYTVTTIDIWVHDYHEFMQAVRDGKIPFQAVTSLSH